MDSLNDNKFYKKDLKEIYKIFDSSETGLASSKTKTWINSGAKNLLTKVPEKTFLSRILVAISEPMVKVLIVAIFLTIIINIMSIEQHQPPDWGQTIGITFSVLLATLVTVFMEKRSQDAFLALKEIGDKRNVKVIREGKTYVVPTEDIFPGDVIFISTGDKIPADGRIIENSDLEIY